MVLQVRYFEALQVIELYFFITAPKVLEKLQAIIFSKYYRFEFLKRQAIELLVFFFF